MIVRTCACMLCVLWCIILHTCSCIMPVFCGARCVHEGFNTLCPCALAHGGACMSMRHVHGHQSSYRRPCGVSCASVCNSRRRDMCMCIGVHAQQCRGFPFLARARLAPSSVCLCPRPGKPVPGRHEPAKPFPLELSGDPRQSRKTQVRVLDTDPSM